MENNDRYKQFGLHQDNVQEIISANDVNAIQTQVQADEQNIFEVRDSQFLSKCLFVLENHPVVNALWIDKLETTDQINMGSFTGLRYVAQESAISLPDDRVTTDATLTTLTYTPNTSSRVAKVILMVQDYQPVNSSISYMISNDGGITWVPIVPNKSLPVLMPATDNRLQIRARLQRTGALNESPVLYAWGLLYEDVMYTPYIPDTMPLSTPLAVPSISHASLIDVLPDQHHPQVHTHNGLDGSGRVYHRSLLGITEDDHHPKSIGTAAYLVRMLESIYKAKLKERFRFGLSRLCSSLVCQVQHRSTGTVAIARYAYQALMRTPTCYSIVQAH